MEVDSTASPHPSFAVPPPNYPSDPRNVAVKPPPAPEQKGGSPLGLPYVFIFSCIDVFVQPSILPAVGLAVN